MTIDFEAKPNSEGLEKGIEKALIKDRPNKDNNRVSKTINEDLLLVGSGMSKQTRSNSRVYQSKKNDEKLNDDSVEQIYVSSSAPNQKFLD